MHCLGRGPGEKKRLKRKNAASVDRAVQMGKDIVDHGDVVATGPKTVGQIPSGGCNPPNKRPTSIAKLHKKRIENTQSVKDVMKITLVQLVNDLNKKYVQCFMTKTFIFISFIF